MNALAVTYEDVKEDVRTVANNYARRRGVTDQDEIQGESNLLFVLAYHKYDQTCGPFDAWVRYFVKMNLLEKSRSIAKRLRREEWLAANPPGGGEGLLSRVLREVGEDAREVVGLLLGGPKGEGPKTALHRTRTALISRGLPVAEVERVFREIQEAL